MKLLKKLYRISSPSNQESQMQKFIISLLKGSGVSYTTDKKGNIYATKGSSETYPCVVCHIDEVHKKRSNGYKVVETNGVIYGLNTSSMQFEGIGADDKNGIWVCLKALSEFDAIKCAFFVAEEVGCQGSRSADMSFFENCRFVLQCDRKGNSDFISTASSVELCSDEFIKDVQLDKFGYKKANGMMTDVMTLKEQGLKVCACNISCGYYNPHTNNEMTRLSDLFRCYALVNSIISNCKKVYHHKYERPVYTSYFHRSFGDYKNSYGHSNSSRFQSDPIVLNLQDLYFSVYKERTTGRYKVYDSKTRGYRYATDEDMQYAYNIEKYRALYSYYDEVKFDKKGNPLVKDKKEQKFHAPDNMVIDAVLGINKEVADHEYEDMYKDMTAEALFNPEGFSLDRFICEYSPSYPNLTYEKYAVACTEIVGSF